ncbi:hypothetical protein OsI_30534 [Oryza sativa Indica Group]|uniref:Uncharacterized protein n=1 Tax=Oryza sativa subsp. indica TaxID=39946 RepID=A2YYX1_ORYSI|nr:hypothetical protein OsI_30534 [Oryza sativa Indica Group]
MDRDRSSRRPRDDDDRHHRSRDDHHRRRHDADDDHRRHKRGGGGDDDDDRRRRRHHRDDEEESRSRRHRHHSDGGRRSLSPSESPPPPAAKRERSSSRAPRDSVERRDSADREAPPPSSRKRKGHEGGGNESDPEGGKRARASVEPPPPKEERPRRERRRFEDADANGKHGDERGKGDKDNSNHGAVNGDSRSGLVPNAGAQQPLNAAPVVVPSSVPMPSKVSSITTTNENEGVSIRSDEVTGKSSTDGSTSSAAGKSSNLSLDALAKAKKALQLKKELSEKLKKLPVLNNKLGVTSTDTQIPKKETQPVSSSGASEMAVGAALTEKMAATAGAVGIPGLANIPNLDAVKRAQELAAKMGFRQDPQFAPLINLFPGTSSELTVPQKPAKAPVLRLDAQGREIDEHGNVINMTKPTNLSTLKVNINKQKKEAFQIIKPDLDSLAKSSAHFDERMGINQNKLLRPRRPGFQFIEEGKLSRQAELQRIKNQFGEAQAKELKVKQAQLAKAKAEVDMNPNLIEVAPGRPPKQKQKEEIPEIEPWDAKILLSTTYDDFSMEKVNMEKITIYVEHPEPLEPPAEPAPPPPQPLKLTKKEQKKLRTQRRLAKEKDRQEMIRQGLLEPPKPKVKMSNLMKVLGAEATQDPTRMELEIRTAAAEREQAHVDRNIARKLTPSERREKKERKLFEDPNTLETIVCVYRMRDLSHPQTRFKVDVNAQENRLTGAAVIADGISVVVVEGGKKSIKRYNKLMLNRIDWAAAVDDDDDADEESDKPVNSCALVWQGSVAKPCFTRFSVHNCRSEAAAKKVFADASVPHYWDLAVNFSEDSS